MEMAYAINKKETDEGRKMTEVRHYMIRVYMVYLFCYDLDMRLWVLDNVYLKDFNGKLYLSNKILHIRSRLSKS